jgi:hypothetical protein
MAEDYARTGSIESKDTGRKIVTALRSLASSDAEGRTWFAGGMGGWRNGTWLKSGWSVQPAPIVGPLVRFWQVTGDQAALDFAVSYAKGIMGNAQPGGLTFNSDGSFVTDALGFKYGHSHATMHALWGVAELGLQIKEPT